MRCITLHISCRVQSVFLAGSSTPQCLSGSHSFSGEWKQTQLQASKSANSIDQKKACCTTSWDGSLDTHQLERWIQTKCFIVTIQSVLAKDIHSQKRSTHCHDTYCRLSCEFDCRSSGPLAEHSELILRALRPSWVSLRRLWWRSVMTRKRRRAPPGSGVCGPGEEPWD